MAVPEKENHDQERKLSGVRAALLSALCVIVFVAGSGALLFGAFGLITSGSSPLNLVLISVGVLTISCFKVASR